MHDEGRFCQSHVLMRFAGLSTLQDSCGQTLLERRMFRRPPLTRRNSMGYYDNRLYQLDLHLYAPCISENSCFDLANSATLDE